MFANRFSMCTATCLILFAAVLALPAEGAILRVANNGVDGAACGPPSAPCLSINAAIANALDGDKIIVDPGRYSPAREGAPAGCTTTCMILVDKRLTIESEKGPEVTVLDAELGPDVVVEIAADGVTFGRRKLGFMITGSGDAGLSIAAGVSGSWVAGNRASCNGGDGFEVLGTDHLVEYNDALDNDADGFYVDADACELRFNEATENDDDGYEIRGDDHVFRRNQARDNVDRGFVLFNGSDHEYRENIASGNGSAGFLVRTGSGDDHVFSQNVFTNNDTVGMNLAGGEGHVLTYNAFIGNKAAGLRTSEDDITVIRNNFFGNDDAGANCGIDNTSGSPLAAPSNFWGVAAGPGADPADAVCGAAVTTPPHALLRYSQPFSYLPLY